MHVLKQTALIGCALLAVAICSPAWSDDSTAAEATFRAGTKQWLTAYNAGDADTIVALYAQDAVVMPPDAPAATGHAAIRTFITRDMASSKTAGITLTDGTSSTGASGDLGWHVGTFTVADGTGKNVGSGKYSEIWQRQNGKWLIIRDMWNNDAPMATMPATPAVPATPPTPATSAVPGTPPKPPN